MRFAPANRPLSDLPAPATYLLALVISFMVTGFLLLLGRVEGVSKTTIALIFLLPVGFSTTVWGLGPGITAAISSFFTFNYFFIEPRHTLTVHDTEDLVILGAFLLVAVATSELAARVKRNLETAQTREREAIQLYELSTTLAGLANEDSIAAILMEKVIDSFQPDRVEIMIEAPRAPLFHTKGMRFNRKPDLLTPMETARGLLGEIRLWRDEKPFREHELRLLKAFSSQSVLAVERARLAEEARRSKVLEESDRLKSALLSSVSHELRTPLAAVKASVSSLRSGTVDWDSEARIDLLTTVEEEVDHLNILVGNLLDMSRIESGALNPEKKPNMLNEIVSAATRRLRQQLQNYQLVVDVSDELPLVSVDYVQMQQVFTNLLTNSMKYSPPGSEIRITARQKNPHQLLINVFNQSMPLPETDLGRIFDKFYRVNPSEKTIGTGLGLSICKGIVEAHGGKIWAENVPNGVTFNFTLPL